MSWYEEYPERLEFELRALDQSGYSYSVDEQEKSAGRLHLTIEYPIAGEKHRLEIYFPVAYPYFPFQVYAPTLTLARHQDPYSKLLCLVAHLATEWRTCDTVAQYLDKQLPRVLEANAGEGGVAEAHEGAPETGYMDYPNGCVIITSEWPLLAQHNRGALLLGIEPDSNPIVQLRASVLEVRDLDNNLLGEADAAIRKRCANTVAARWVRLSQAPKSKDAAEILKEAIQVWPDLGNLRFSSGLDVVGIVFKSAARYRELHDLWTFVVRRKDRLVPRASNKRRPPGDQVSIYPVRGDRGGKDDLGTRVPRLNSLATKKAVVFGLGALGSASAWQLAKAGVGRITLVDHDVVQAGNLPRWALGWPAIGFNKAHILAAWIALNYPYTSVTVFGLRVGDSTPEEHDSLMKDTFDQTNVLLDFTVEFTVHHFLSSKAWEKRVPYVWASGTTGAWGGIVGRAHRHSDGGCWECFKRHQKNRTYAEPLSEDTPDVQPIGCFSPTFTGSGIDLDIVSGMAARLAVSTMCADEPGGYPDFQWDVGVVDLWENGLPIAPRWKTHLLQKHPECGLHP